MSSNAMALAELLLIFGAVIAFVVYELVSLKRDKKESKDGDNKEPADE